jgi:hypothetical protein
MIEGVFTKRRIAVVAALLAAAITGSGPVFAEDVQMHAVASESGKTIFYTTCSVDEFSECIDYMFGCEEDGEASAPGDLSLMISGLEEEDKSNTRSIMNTVVDKPYDDVSAHFVLAGGKANVDLPAISLNLMSNEMNAAWDLTVELYRAEALFDLLDETSAKEVKVELGGETVNLTPEPGDGAKLLALKTACSEPAQ